MARQSGQELAMKWVRLWCEKLTAPKSDTWAKLDDAWELYSKLMCLAGVAEADGKVVIPGTESGYTQQQLAEKCKMPQDRFDVQFQKLMTTELVIQQPKNVLVMVNWKEWQTAYSAQVSKGYRGGLRPKVTPKGYEQKTEGRGEEGEDEKKRESLERADALVNQFADAFREATGEEYDRNWPTDRKWAKELLAKHGPATADLLKTRLANAIAAHKNNTADYWRFPSCARQLSGAGWNKYATPPPSNGQRPRLADTTRRAMTPAEVEASLRD